MARRRSSLSPVVLVTCLALGACSAQTVSAGTGADGTRSAGTPTPSRATSASGPSAPEPATSASGATASEGGTVDVDTGAGDPGLAAVPLAPGGVDTAVAQLPALVQRVMAESKVPGVAVAVVRDGRTVYTGGFGVRRVGSPEKVDPQTVFMLASVSKPIAATVVASQVSKKVVSWDTPIAEKLPSFALSDPWVTSHVTVGDAFAHRTGLPETSGDLLEDIGHDRDYVLSHLRYEPLRPFRTSYGYANFGLTAGAEAVAKAAGTDWATLSQNAVYGPLGMTSTSSRHRDFLARPDRAQPHALVGGRFQPLYDRDPDAQSPAGGVSSNVVDMARWMTMVLGQGTAGGTRVAAAADLLPALRPQAVNAPPSDPSARTGSYGYGFNVGVQPGGRVLLNHSGAFLLGTGTAVMMLPSARVGIVVLTNGTPVGAAESIGATFVDTVQFGRPTRDWWPAFSGRLAALREPAGDLAGTSRPASPASPSALSTYTGTYRNDFYGDLVVSEQKGALVAALGPGGRYRLPLAPWDGSTFAVTPTGENAPEGSRSSARFTVSGGRATSVQVPFFDATGLGTWRR